MSHSDILTKLLSDADSKAVRKPGEVLDLTDEGRPGTPSYDLTNPNLHYGTESRDASGMRIFERSRHNSPSLFVQHVIGALERVFQAGGLVHPLEQVMAQHPAKRVDLPDPLVEHVDSLIVVLNEKLLEVLGDVPFGTMIRSH